MLRWALRFCQRLTWIQTHRHTHTSQCGLLLTLGHGFCVSLGLNIVGNIWDNASKRLNKMKSKGGVYLGHLNAQLYAECMAMRSWIYFWLCKIRNCYMMRVKQSVLELRHPTTEQLLSSPLLNSSSAFHHKTKQLLIIFRVRPCGRKAILLLLSNR